MRQKSANQKTSQRKPEDVDHAPSAGVNGLTIAPPAYGIDSVDRGLTESQMSSAAVTQRQADVADTEDDAGAPAENKTGLPDTLKDGIESLSGLALDNVRVHYNSDKPAQLQALAYTQGTDIHVAPGQERHLPHEAWHVVQQAQGCVKTTMQLKGGVPVNDDAGLEREADVMGAKAVARGTSKDRTQNARTGASASLSDGERGNVGADGVLQRKVTLDLEQVPLPASIVHISGIDRTPTPKVDDIPGNMGADAARHIIPSALLQREFKARYTGRTVHYLQKFFPGVKLDQNYLINLAQAMWSTFVYETMQLDEARNNPFYPRPKSATDQGDRIALPDLSNHPGSTTLTPFYRNYWAGSQKGNLAKDTKATSLLAAAKSQNKMIKALSTEFDPPPFALKSELKAMAAEWARLTNSWLTNDAVAHKAYWPGRDLTWWDAFEAPENANIFNNAK